MAAPQNILSAELLKGLAGYRVNGSEPKADDAVAVDLIDEDPNQPRKDFGDLDALAASIRRRGVLQPVGILRGEGGRHRLVYGARRLRAAKLAGLTTIPVYHVRDDQVGLEAQMIENQHRRTFTNSEIGRGVNALVADGLPKDEVCLIANIPEHVFWACRSIPHMSPSLCRIIDHSDIQAIYRLHKAWEKSSDGAKSVIERIVDSLDGTNPDHYLTRPKAEEISRIATESNDLAVPSAEEALSREQPEPVRKAGRRIARKGDAKLRIPPKVECQRWRSIVEELLAELSKTRRAAMEKRIQEVLAAPVPEKGKP
jgi:ParB family chromosome partitioning protein